VGGRGRGRYHGAGGGAREVKAPPPPELHHRTSVRSLPLLTYGHQHLAQALHHLHVCVRVCVCVCACMCACMCVLVCVSIIWEHDLWT
jgi:hypothetical protein